MKTYFIALLYILLFCLPTAAQKKVSIYRSGVAILPSYSTADSAIKAALSGDSLVLSAHTFYEDSLNAGAKKLILKGTQTSTDSTIIDASGAGFFYYATALTRFKDIIFQNGKGGFKIISSTPLTDTVRFSGNTIIRNSVSENDSLPFIHCTRFSLSIENNTKIHNNNLSASLISGAQFFLTLKDKASIFNNHSIGYLAKGSSWESNNGLILCSYGIHLKDSFKYYDNSTDTGKTAGFYINPWTAGVPIFRVEDGVRLSGNKVIRPGYGKGAVIFVDNVVGRTSDPELKIGAAIFSNNEAYEGGAIHVADSQTKIVLNGTVFNGNKAKNGGAIYCRGQLNIVNANFYNNIADSGTAIFINTKVSSTKTNFIEISSSRFFDRDASGKRPNEIYATYYPTTKLPPSIVLYNNWWGKNDTIGAIKEFPSGIVNHPTFANTNWSVKNGIPVVAGDTTFAIGSLMKQNAGALMPKNSLPMLRGYFFVDTGNVSPGSNTSDSMNFVGTTYRSYLASSLTSSPCNVLAYIDEDTFKTSFIVWSNDTTMKLTIQNAVNPVVLVYPNPASNYLYISGLKGNHSVEFIDISGKSIKTLQSQSHEIKIDVSDLPNGQYLLIVIDEKGKKGASNFLKQ